MYRKTYVVMQMRNRRMDTSSQLQEAKAYIGRILYDIPCKVCQDHSSGKHYGIFACDGCAGFFKRSIRRQRQYVCKAKAEGSCIVDKTHRNQCRACRLRKCVHAGMNKDAVQHERGPRNSTLRRQMALYYKERHSPPPPTPGVAMPPPHPTVLDLALPKGPRPEHPHPLLQASSVVPAAAASFFCSPAAFAAAMPKFPIGLPSPFPAETVRETAARVLFMNVTWVKSVPAFTGLDLQDQLALLEQSWRELFVLGAAQFMLPLELAQLASMSSTLLHEVKAFQDTLAKFRQLRVDAQEYTYMKLIVLFKSGGAKVDVASVAALQDQTQLALSKHVATTHPDQPLRFGKLLLLLPTLRCIAASTIEELFFRRTIGHIHIERIICDMYKASDL